MEEVLGLLKDDQQQYVQCRVVDTKNRDNSSKVRDVLITWSGKKIPPLKKGKLVEHREAIAKMFDTHAHLTCNGDRSNFKYDLIVKRSAPLSGSHEL